MSQSDTLGSMTAQMPMDFTGERMVPEAAPFDTFWEHIYRYRYAMAFVPGKRVLDIACGEGYGSAAFMRGGALQVVGVDISPETCEHARSKYGVDARVGNAEAIPLDDQSMDVIVSFETIEHVPSPAKFIAECRRVLKPNGKLVISTPNKIVYGVHTPNNPYHCSELTVPEFRALLADGFRIESLRGQSPRRTAAWSPTSWSDPESFWWQTRYVRRGARIFARAMGYKGESESRELRERAPELIARDISRATRFFSPYLVRKLPDSELFSAVYVVAVATRVQ